MDIVGTTLSAAQTLFGALQCLELRETMSIFGYKNQLDDLQATVSYIQKVLHDAEVMQELSHENRLWVEEIKDAIFEADDLLDEFVTLSEQEKLRDAHAGGSLSNKLRSFFSDSKAPGVAYRMSKGVKKIKKKFDAISDNRRYSLNLDVKLVRKKGVKTCSFVKADEVIGREDDLEKIVGMLLDSDVQRDVSFLTVVGMGGLGKTTLAQLVYNDPRVKNAFSLRKWAWVSDLVPEQLDVTEILGKILDKNHEGSTMDLVQSQFNKLLAGEKYLLVLDDVWTENCYQWRTLVRYFTGGQRGSWIVVTTRSLETARIVGNGPTWKLQGLSKEHSWRFFERNAFELGQSNPPNDLVQIGEEIVDRCGQVPIAISAVGSLLYGQDKSKWLSLLAIGLANIRERKNDIMPILMLSYHNLESPIKICFSYCAVFPKNFLIKKKILISLWIAQGYIVSLDEGQSIEDAGEEYFSILLRRCFFQALGNEEDGTIRIHDLMHDIAQKVMGKELCTTKTCSGNLDKKVRHLSLARSKFAMFSFNKTHIRSYFYAGYWHHDSEMDSFPVEALVPSCTCLRALDLAWSKITSLPESIGGLLHLRYLDLSFNGELEVLPKSITKLYNLQTLRLSRCSRLKELPKDLGRLIKLRMLDIDGCNKLTCMPQGMGKLTMLHTLTMFMVGREGICSSWKQWFDGLEDLKVLNNLKGFLEIQIRWPKNTTDDVREDGCSKGLYLRHKEHLKHVVVDFKREEGSRRMNDDQARRLMEQLQPHSNLNKLIVRGYQGARMPSWTTLLPNLAELRLFNCGELIYLSCLGNLHDLKVLKLWGLPKLEYFVEDTPSTGRSGSGGAKGVSLFPSLERLELKNLQRLTGWRREEVGADHQLLNDSSSSEAPLQLTFCLPQLKSLDIERCPSLTCIPLCPRLETLHLAEFNNRLRIVNLEEDKNLGSSPLLLSSLPENLRSFIPTPKLRHVHINNVAWLKFLPMEALRCVTTMTIKKDDVECLGEVVDVFRSCSSSLRLLSIESCSNLISISGGLEHLTALEILHIRDTPKLSLSEERENGMPWKSLHHSLAHLELMGLSQLVEIPNWMQFLVTLKTLTVVWCSQLESVPNWMPKLTSLEKLKISYCSTRLEQRCQNPTGEDWQNIQYIPTIEITSGAPSILVLPL